jgi:hypothetical protein
MDRVAVRWVAPNANEDDTRLRQVACERRFDPVLREVGHAVAARYGASTTPHVFVIDERGVLRYAGGPDDVSLRQRAPTRGHMAGAVQALRPG